MDLTRGELKCRLFLVMRMLGKQNHPHRKETYGFTAEECEMLTDLYNYLANNLRHKEEWE